MYQPAKEGAGRDDDSARRKLAAVSKPDTSDATVRDEQVVGLSFDHSEVRGLADRGLHGGSVKFPIRLGPRASHGRALAPIEHAKLNACGICDSAHQPVERVDLPHQMALAEASDRRVAGHRPDGREAMGYQGGPGANARGSTRCFATGVTSSNNNNVE
jgi:hypothetical protein